jgi:5'-nucleotidase
MKKYLHIDMDGVLADFQGAMASIAPELYIGEHPDYEKTAALVRAACRKHNHIFYHLEPLPGAIEAVKELSAYYEIRFLSTPMDEVPDSYTDKKLWLDQHFGPAFAYKKLILSHEKNIVLGHYLIDDTLRNGVTGFMGKHIHFGTAEFPNWDITKQFMIRQAKLPMPKDRNELLADLLINKAA